MVRLVVIDRIWAADFCERIERDTSPMRAMSDRAVWLFIGILGGSALGLALGQSGELNRTEPKPRRVALPVAQAGGVAKPGCGTQFPMSPRVSAALRQGAPLRIGIFGDSFADGIWGAARTEFDRNPAFEVIRFSKAGTGFTTYHISDRYRDASDKLVAQPIDIALISFGANDAQAIMVDGHVAPLMSPAWQKVIGGRASAFMRLIRDQGIAVAWVGLPGMRSPKFDRKAHLMTGFFKDLACQNQLAFLDPSMMTEASGHRYLTELKDPKSGKSYVARASDGIHMSMAGYRFLAAPLFNQIKGLKQRKDKVPDHPGG